MSVATSATGILKTRITPRRWWRNAAMPRTRSCSGASSPFEVIEELDHSALERAYAGRGSPPYHPALLLALLIYGYATGCYSSRKIEWATYDSLAFRFIAANSHPDHDTLATFRRRFAKEFEATFV